MSVQSAASFDITIDAVGNGAGCKATAWRSFGAIYIDNMWLYQLWHVDLSPWHMKLVLFSNNMPFACLAHDMRAF